MALLSVKIEIYRLPFLGENLYKIIILAPGRR
jgi:hypothetical protein